MAMRPNFSPTSMPRALTLPEDLIDGAWGGCHPSHLFPTQIIATDATSVKTSYNLLVKVPARAFLTFGARYAILSLESHGTQLL